MVEWAELRSPRVILRVIEVSYSSAAMVCGSVQPVAGGVSGHGSTACFTTATVVRLLSSGAGPVGGVDKRWGMERLER